MWSNRGGPEVTALIIDGTNAYEAAKAARMMLDYQKILRVFRPQQAWYFTALPKKDRDGDPNNLFKMIDHVSYNGYQLVTKPMKTFMNQGVEVKKGNMDAEIVLGMIRAAEWANHIVLFSGDGDFRSVVEYVQHQGVRVTVVSALHTSPPMVADELRRQANHFLDFCDPVFREKIYMEKGER